MTIHEVLEPRPVDPALGGIGIALLLGHIHDFADALQAFALPIGAIANLQHVSTSVAHIGFQHIFQLIAAWVVFHAWPVWNKPPVGHNC